MLYQSSSRTSCLSPRLGEVGMLPDLDLRVLNGTGNFKQMK